MNTAEKYVKSVKKGEILVCRFALAAVDRHLAELKESKKKAYPYYYDNDLATQVIDDMRGLKLWQGKAAGQWLELMPHHAFMTGQLIGWRRKADKMRRFSEAYIEMARKGAKSAWSGALLAWFFRKYDEFGGEIYTAATKRDQAFFVYRHAQNMLRRSKWESEDSQIKIMQYKMKRPSIDATFEYLASNKDTMDGSNPFIGVLDELHQHKTPDAYNALSTGMGERADPLLLCISTAGSNHHGIGKQQRDYAASILKGVVDDPTFFAMLFTLDVKSDWPDLLSAEDVKKGMEGTPEDDYRNPDVWIKANPGIEYGVPTKEYIEKQLRKTEGIPSLLNEVLTKHFSLWVSSAECWIDINLWDQSQPKKHKERRLRAFGGIDLSGWNDLTSACFVVPQSNYLEIHSLTWACEAWLDLPDNPFKEQFRQWAKDGHVIIHKDNVIDLDRVMVELLEWKKRMKFRIDSMTVERGFDGRQFATRLDKKIGGSTKRPKVVALGMGQLTASILEIEGLLRNKKLMHFDNPVLRFGVSNVGIRLDQSQRRKTPEKQGSDHHKIDPAVAMFFAVDRYLKFAGGGYGDQQNEK